MKKRVLHLATLSCAIALQIMSLQNCSPVAFETARTGGSTLENSNASLLGEEIQCLESGREYRVGDQVTRPCPSGDGSRTLQCMTTGMMNQVGGFCPPSPSDPLCNYQGAQLVIGSRRSEACASNEVGVKTLECQKQNSNAAMVVIANTCKPVPVQSITCTHNGSTLSLGTQRTESCPTGQSGSKTLQCQRTGGIGSMVVIANTCQMTSTTSYSWKIGNFGACSARPTWFLGAWGSCQNNSCSTAEQTRTVQCVNETGTQTGSITCVNNSNGQTVADAYCANIAKPSATQSCTISCSAASRPVDRQNCPVVGTPCQYSLTDIRTDPAGDAVRLECWIAPCPTDKPAFSPGSVVRVTMGAMNNAYDINGRTGTCPAGQGPSVYNLYECTNVCPSGQYRDEYYTINNGDINYQGAYQDVRRRVCL